jgi:hypothetical protein
VCWRTMERHYAPSVYDPEFEHLVEVLALRVRMAPWDGRRWRDLHDHLRIAQHFSVEMRTFYQRLADAILDNREDRWL